jgi:hypothetical protein
MDEEILIPITMFISTAFILWKYFEARHKERMYIVEKGLVNEELRYLYNRQPADPNRNATLKWGLIVILIGASLLIAIPLQQIPGIKEYNGMLIPGLIFFAAGLGFLLYYAIASRKERTQ